ncbi:trypsin delta [Folsomia candida]|uniref:Trypsin-7 n=1 Tax=Folsomia candida TaxID=158441 RepID=A0A226DNA1_FOLCA|nr:trypsin delta [Folsomia candida]OXA46324.1 Trypsin-7 [Folsomia candida]
MKLITFVIVVFTALLGNTQSVEGHPTNFTTNGKGIENNILIVGGEPANIEDFPYQVSLQFNGAHFCGGSLISPDRVLTAAHCTNGKEASTLSVRAGSSYHKAGGQVISVKTICQHPLFNSLLMTYDVSVLTLESSFVLGPAVQTIALGSSRPIAGTPGTVTGWGRLWDNGPIPALLQVIQVPVVHQLQCATGYLPKLITNTMMCAGFLGVGWKDACQGDSGGPFVMEGVQFGIVSWGQPSCADPNYPGVYTFVGSVQNHIDAC